MRARLPDDPAMPDPKNLMGLKIVSTYIGRFGAVHGAMAGRWLVARAGWPAPPRHVMVADPKAGKPPFAPSRDTKAIVSHVLTIAGAYDLGR